MTNDGIEVRIDCPIGVGHSYMPLLHAESNGNEAYDFGDGFTDVDTPMAVNGKIVAQSFLGG